MRAWLQHTLNKALTMKWLLIAAVLIADKIYDRYFGEADDE